ncbi:MAG: hypothetical protein EKK39_13330 [Sphingobacteriales bacterium]|nr:MAG: hypothetical protein EKK39_13330 [Sphingobacteriales bacterium]
MKRKSKTIEIFQNNTPKNVDVWIDRYKYDNRLQLFLNDFELNISECEEGVQLYNELCRNFNENFRNEDEKELLIKSEINKYTNIKTHNSTDELQYMAKGFSFYENRKKITLKDFLYYDKLPNLNSLHGFRAVSQFTSIDEMLIIWKTRKEYFIATSKGWVYAKYISYLNNLLENPSALPPQQSKTKTEQETPKTFEELFYNTDLVKPCIDILKNLDPPLIDRECNYIGSLKGVFCVWIDEMQKQGIVKHFSDRKIYASLLEQRINRFSIYESMFGKYQKKANNQYRTDIKTLLSQIKLSQNSQKGKLGK